MHETVAVAAAALTMIAAIMVALNLGARITGYGFIVFAFGSVAWIVVAWLTDQKSLLWTNALLLIINAVGIWRWLGVRARYDKGAAAANESVST